MRASDDYTEAIGLKSNIARAYLDRGTKHVYRGDFDKAIADYAEAIRFKPDYAEAYCHQGEACRKKGEEDFAKAEEPGFEPD